MNFFNVPKTKKEILQGVRVAAYSLYMVDEEEDFNNFLDEWVNLNPVFAYNKKTGEYMITYHNWCHMGHVTILAQQFGNYLNLDHYDLVVMFFATMFHDFKHSFGELCDAENIQIALSEFEYFITHNKFCVNYIAKKFPTLFLKSKFIRDVYETIYRTEYPFIHKAVSPVQKVMRDIDLTMSLSPLDIFGIGLTNETKNKFGTLDRFTMAEFALQQDFYYPEIKETIKNWLETERNEA